MLINVCHGGKPIVFHVNANHILCVGQSDDAYHMQLMTSDDYAYQIDRESYERVIDWMERQEDACILRAAIESDDGERHSMAEDMETIGKDNDDE